MKYLITYFNKLDYSELYDTRIYTCIVDGKLNVLKLFLKHLNKTCWSNETQNFKCSCDIHYEFSLEYDDFYEEGSDYCVINYKTLHEKMSNNDYICNICQNTFNDKGNEIINFVKKIYNDCIDDYLSITQHMQCICKIGIQQLDIKEKEKKEENGIIYKMSMPILDDNDCYSKDSTEYNENHFGSRAEDVDL